MNNKKRIIVTVRGGVIQYISGIPQDVIVEVRDFDVEGVERHFLESTSNGDLYIMGEWEGTNND